MPQQRKATTAAATREDGRAGKAAAAAGGNTTRGAAAAAAANNNNVAAADNAATAAAVSTAALPYTSEEVTFLHTHLRQLSALQAGGSGDAANAWRDAWPSMLPTLTSIVGKALKLAEDNYTIRTANNNNSTSTAAATAAGAATTMTTSAVATFSNGIGIDGLVGGNSNSSSSNNMTSRDSLGKSTTVSGTSATLRDCAGGDASTNASSVQPLSHAQFAEENAYLLEQLQQLPCTPFTIVRLLELLSSPLQHHRNGEGKLRGDMLQASLRRCILVSFPAFASSAAAAAGGGGVGGSGGGGGDMM